MKFNLRNMARVFLLRLTILIVFIVFGYSKYYAQNDCENKFILDTNFESFLIPVCELKTYDDYRITINNGLTYAFSIIDSALKVHKYNSEGIVIISGDYDKPETFKTRNHKMYGDSSITVEKRNLIYEAIRNGKWEYFDDEGNPIKIETYDKGVLIVEKLK